MKTLLFKTLSLFALCLLIQTSARAMGGSVPSGSGGYGCSASDNGWEEHFGGHSSCGECLSRHGSCSERCYETSYSCSAVGTRYDGSQDTITAHDRFEYGARDEAMRRCYYSGLRDCHSSYCNTESNLVSSRSCGR